MSDADSVSVSDTNPGKTPAAYDAILIVNFGGPEQPEDVIPFLENVLRGRNVPRERMLEVAEHYYHFGGASPINQQTRDLIAALRPELDRRGLGRLPIYWGNRNWHPLLTNTVRQMADDGVRRAIAVVQAAYSSYSSCRQYRENLRDAQAAVGDRAPICDKLRVFYNHPGFISANADRVSDALGRIPEARRSQAHCAFTAHSIPNTMADHCDYVAQLTETCRLVAEAAGIGTDRWRLVYQSRSGRPSDPWLEPDISDHLRDLRAQGVEDVVVHPVGFLSDHMEVLFDLDEEAHQAAEEIGLRLQRSSTVGIHPDFVAMFGELIQERVEGWPDRDRRAIGSRGPNHDVCPADCCLVRGPSGAKR